MNLHVSTAARRILAAAAVTCAAAATPAMALASTSGHPGIPGAGAKAVSHKATNCTDFSPFFFNVTKNGTNYWLGAPNTVASGKAATLKPRQNRETSWTLCLSNTSSMTLIENGGMALTSRATSPGADVTLTPRHGINGFASQQWRRIVIQSGRVFRYQNVKTGLWLRVRNSGPVGFQTVTTGSMATNWVVVSP